ncbi:MAG TPA: hypothetical protein EYO59_00570 [Chromatiaceae bacterium]|nr:hypothetical protein [Chromatiaceae bacterium]
MHKNAYALREIAMLQAFKTHPNIVTLLSLYANPKCLILVFANHKQFSEEQHKEPKRFMDVKENQRMHKQLAGALAFINAQGVMHLDVKPDNILMDGQGRYLLTDLGGSCDASLSLNGMECVTRHFRSLTACLTHAKYPVDQTDMVARSDLSSLSTMLLALMVPSLAAKGKLGRLSILCGDWYGSVPLETINSMTRAIVFAQIREHATGDKKLRADLRSHLWRKIIFPHMQVEEAGISVRRHRKRLKKAKTYFGEIESRALKCIRYHNKMMVELLSRRQISDDPEAPKYIDKLCRDMLELGS